MSLQRAVCVPFLRRDEERVTKAEFVYTLSADAGWFEPDEAEEIFERGIEENLLREEGGSVRALFELESMEEPEAKPDVPNRGSGSVSGSIDPGVFEKAVESFVASGYGKREAVALINRKHANMGDASIEAAALLTLKQEGAEVSSLAEEALEDL